MGQTITYGIAAGVVTALLIGAVVTGVPLAILLYFFTPLPLFMVAERLGPQAGYFCAAAATLVLIAATHWSLALVYAASFGVPGALLVALAGSSNPDRAQNSNRALALAVLIAGGFGAANILLLGPGEEAYRETVKSVFEVVRSQLGTLSGKQIPPAEAALLLDVMARILPALTAVGWLALMLGNLWLAGRIVPGPQDRRWSSADIELPGWMPLTFMASLALTYFTSGETSLLASAFAAAHGAGYLLQGLSLVHRMSRGHALRTLILILTYLALLIAGSYAIFALISFALAAPVLGLDRRRPSLPNKPST